MSLRAPIILSRKIILSFFQNVDCKILSFSDTNIKIVMRVPHFFFFVKIDYSGLSCFSQSSVSIF